MIGLLNIGSLILGLIAWALPVISLGQCKRQGTGSWGWDWIIASIISLGACASSLWLQVVYNRYLVKISDWTALMDTVDTLVVLSATLLIGTLILNGTTWIICRKRQSK